MHLGTAGLLFVLSSEFVSTSKPPLSIATFHAQQIISCAVVHRNFHQLLSHGNCTGARTWCTSSNFETFWDSCHWDQRFQLRVIDRWCRPGATDRGTLSPTSDHLVLTCTWRSTITLCLTISHFSLNLAHKRIRCSASQQSWLEVHIGEGNAAEVEVGGKFYLLPPPFAFPPAFLTQPGWTPASSYQAPIT